MIGNDIIDKSLAAIESNWQRKGFLEKQFTKKEQDVIVNAENPFEMVWLLWSMKESAYKIYAQQCEERFFAPIKFECEIRDNFEGTVYFREKNYFTKSVLNEEYIFTIAGLGKETKVYSYLGASKGITERIKKKLHHETGILFSEIEQKKAKNGAPNYYHKDKPLLKSCSITHHGKYGAFSLFEFNA